MSDNGHPQIRIEVNGETLGTIYADTMRVDLAAAGYGDGSYGFALEVPVRLRPIRSVEAIIVDSGEALAKSSGFSIEPQTLPDRWMPRNGKHPLPSFFILGAARSGTTALHAYLDRHPDICMSDPKEPVFFEAEYDRGTEYYFRHYFSHWRGESIVGESRHRNLYLPHALNHLAAYNPDAKLVTLLRNPTERAISHWWFWRVYGSEPLSLREAIAADLQRIASDRLDGSRDEFEAYAATLDLTVPGPRRTYVDSGYYERQLSRYMQRYDRGNFRIIIFEDFVADPQRVAEDTCAFLGADPGRLPRVPSAKINPSAPGMNEHVDPQTLALLVEHFRPHNERLETLLGRSLSHWDRPFEAVSTTERRMQS